MNDFAALINVYKDQTALIYTLWSVFQGLSLAIIGFVFSQEYVRKNPVLLACLSGSILVFSLGNHAAIMRAQALVVAATGELNAAAVTPCLDLKKVFCAFQAPERICWPGRTLPFRYVPPSAYGSPFWRP
jgi:hypothetical protein